jgi:hypothetical protein
VPDLQKIVYDAQGRLAQITQGAGPEARVWSLSHDSRTAAGDPLGSAEGGSTAPILLTSVVAGNLRALPAFNERDGLADRIATRGQAMGGALTSLTGVEERETDLRADLRRLIDAQRVAIVATYGRLLGILPKRFVETLFPHPRSKHGTGPVRRRRWASPPAPVADGPGRASADRRRPAPHPIPALPPRRSAGARMRSAPPRRRSTRARHRERRAARLAAREASAAD